MKYNPLLLLLLGLFAITSVSCTKNTPQSSEKSPNNSDTQKSQADLPSAAPLKTQLSTAEIKSIEVAGFVITDPPDKILTAYAAKGSRRCNDYKDGDFVECIAVDIPKILGTGSFKLKYYKKKLESFSVASFGSSMSIAQIDVALNELKNKFGDYSEPSPDVCMLSLGAIDCFFGKKCFFRWKVAGGILQAGTSALGGLNGKVACANFKEEKKDRTDFKLDDLEWFTDETIAMRAQQDAIDLEKKKQGIKEQEKKGLGL